MNQTGTVVLILALFIIMFGMGLTLTKDDFRRILKYPKAVITGLVNQLIFLPLIGFALATLMDLDPKIAVGIMILAACPGGATSNLITHLSKGDTALSVTLTALSSMITIITIPLIVSFSISHFMGIQQDVVLDIPSVFAQLLIIIVIPVSLGMFVRSKNSDFADRMERPVKIASAIVLAIVIAGVIAQEKDNIVQYFEQAGISALLLNVSTMSLGFISAKLLKLTFPQTITISIESGIQNGTLAIGIATIALKSADLAFPAAVYSLIMFATGFAIILIGTQQSSKVLNSNEDSQSR